MNTNNKEDDLILNNMQLPVILASKYVRKHPYLKNMYDDLLAEGYLTLVECSKKFNEDRNVKFVSYASVCINGKMQNLSKNNTSTVPIDCIELEDTRVDLEQNYISYDNLDSILLTLSSLNDIDKEVMTLCMEGMNKSNIASQLNCSITKVTNSMNRIKTKINEVLQ